MNKIKNGIFSLILIAGLLPTNNVQVNAIANSIVLGSASITVLLHSPILLDSEITANFTGTVTRIRVFITNGSDGDKLSTPNYSDCNYNSSTYVLSCDGTFTSTQVTNILRDIYFDSISNDLTTRSFEYSVGASIIPFEVAPGEYHYYEYISDGLYWSEALAAAESHTFEGMTGYLATVMSAEENNFISTKLGQNAWLGGTDDYSYINDAAGSEIYADQDESEGNWYWVTGPEKGQMFSEGNYNPVVVSGMYQSFADEEPNNSGSEHYLEIYVDDQAWNDLSDDNEFGYVVEYSGGSNVNLVALSTTKTIEIDSKVIKYFVKESSVSGTVPVDTKIDYVAGDTVTVLGNTGNLAKEGYVFLGWSDGTTIYKAGDTFTFDGRTVLTAVLSAFSLTDEPVFYLKDSGNSYRVDSDQLTVYNIMTSKITVSLPDKITGDSLWFDISDDTYTCYDEVCYDPDTDEYTQYDLTSTYDEETMVLTIRTDVPVPAGQIWTFVSNVYFATTGEYGDRTATVSIYSDETTVLISDSRTITVYDGFTVVYADDEHMSIPVDENVYGNNDEVSIGIPMDINYPGYRFFYWLGSDGNIYFPDWNFDIKEDMVMTAIYAPSFEDTIGVSDIFSDGLTITGFEDVISTYFTNYNSYDEWKAFLKIYKQDENDVNNDDFDLFMDYFTTENPDDDHEYIFMDMMMWIAYWNNGDVPSYNSFDYLGDGSVSKFITVSFILPEELRGKSDYKIIRIHNDGEQTIIDEIETTYDPVTFVITFKTDRFSTYSMTYAKTGDLPNTGKSGDYGALIILAGLILASMTSRRIKN
ncbi:MAG: hypothetical protein HGB31_01500 [Erysipelotrichaceae bacterium]|nr:hypothetical protein [Erysipelotrichaceae bacterium]